MEKETRVPEESRAIPAPGGFWRGALSRARNLWAKRRRLRGFAPLLFYCHMLMLFSALAKTRLADATDLALLLQISALLVPILFTLTTVSLFLSRAFDLALALGFAHAVFGLAALFLSEPFRLPWLAGMAGLGLLLIFALFRRRRAPTA